jgi:hypothetical protein
MVFDLLVYLKKQIKWSRDVFGDGKRTEGILKHIEKESIEVREAPLDVEEWVDIVILALDGAWRAGYTPEQIAETMCLKQLKNFCREWNVPESEDEPVMHIKGE